MKIVRRLFTFLIVATLLLLLGNMTYQYVELQGCNQKPLEIQTFDGRDSPYHPSVIYSSEGWNGYHYMMSETPFYFGLPSVGDDYRDQYENPSIHYSNDGITWTICIKPLDSLSKEQKLNRDYYSDPDLVVTPSGVECWYRLNKRYGKETNQDNIVLYRRVSKDGINWDKAQIIADLEHGEHYESLGHTVISQTLIYEEGKYKMWFVSGGGTHNGVLEYAESDSSLVSWTQKRKIVLDGPTIAPWHQHILKDEDIYWLTIYDHNKNISIWKGETETTFKYVSTPIQSSSIIGSYYSNDLYRACLIKRPEGGYRLYYSADDMFKSYIGIMEGDTPESLMVASIEEGKHTSFSQYVALYFKTYYTIWSRKIKYYSRRIIEKPIELIKKKNG